MKKQKNKFFAIGVALALHAGAFGTFCISMGKTIGMHSFAPVMCIAPIPYQMGVARLADAPFSVDGALLPVRGARAASSDVGDDWQMKPACPVSLVSRKDIGAPRSVLGRSLPPRDSSIMFHPLLPYQFELYFKDRQSVHIELAFRMIPGIDKNSLEIKRKISSGNLEADLLSLRSMHNYLFLQQGKLIPHEWQNVTIELTTGTHEH
jgi:hypothetical protein